MAEKDSLNPFTVSPEHRRVAAGQFERANQVIATGNFDYGIRLLLSCCKLDPANLIFRQALRRTEKAKYKNNMRGSWLSWLTSSPKRAKLKAAKHGKEYLKVLDYGEDVLARNPWDTSVQLDMADAADILGLLDLAIWILEQARQKNARDISVNRHLARLYEKRGNFTQAIALWEVVRKDDPKDMVAFSKAKDLAANQTIARINSEEINGPSYEMPVLDESALHDTPQARSTADPNPTPLPNFGSSTPPEGAQPLSGERVSRDTAQLRERIQENPTDSFGYVRLAAQSRRMGKLDEARTILESGLGPTGNDPTLTFELADLEIEPFRRNLAVTEGKIQTEPNNEELRKIRIRLLKEINARELDLFRQKAERYPAELGHRFELGLRLLRANHIDEAIRELQAARSDARYLWRSLLYLGYCFKSRNNWKLARRNFEECLRTIPLGEEVARKETLFQLAKGCADAGETQPAVDFANELANLDFNYREIGKLLDAWQEQLQREQVSR
ncbi:MAG TPA: tetratricopeptide repeat protein [Gemmataceae bacterium]|nr:tetratricopeptide repeat protein [Gemmataceae bacterium]